MRDTQHVRSHRPLLPRWWRSLNEMRSLGRVPIKVLLFAGVLLVVLFPSPDMLLRQIHRLRHLDQMIEPNAPGLAEVAADLGSRLDASLTPRQVQKRVEKYVHETIPYAWDWDTWNVVDYIPTVPEVLEKRREDCDGRAVLAASLLRRLGQDAMLATDLRHVWVTVGRDELMGPGAAKSAVSTPTGTQVNWHTLSNVPRTLAFGVAVFPLSREAILVATILLLMAPARMRCVAFVFATATLLAGWAFLRQGVVVAPDLSGFSERTWASWIGLILSLAGLLSLWLTGGRAVRSDSTKAASPADNT